MFHSVLLPDPVTDGVFLDVEANFGFGRLWRRFQQGAELLEDFPQRHVMNQQRLAYFREASENGGIGGDLLAHFDEGADDLDARGDGAGAVEDIGGHERAVFGEDHRQVADIALGCGRKLRPHTPGYVHGRNLRP